MMLNTTMTKEQSKDTGMALVLILLLVWGYTRHDAFVLTAIGLHVVSMTVPQVFRPAAVVWFGLSHILGAVVSRLILGGVFFVVVTPVAIWRRVFKLDSLQLREFKTGQGSVMKERNHTYTGKDLEQPY
jgi:polyferredoxin